MPSFRLWGSRVAFYLLPMEPKVHLTDDRMYEALVARDPSYAGWFVVGVRSTGIFCRTPCTARKPKRENVEFFATPQQAMARGYRPCKVCRPLDPPGHPPEWIARLLEDLGNATRCSDRDLRARGWEPGRVRRWFKKNRGKTFQAYLRERRLGEGLKELNQGGLVVETAFDSGYESLSGFTEAFKKWMGAAPSLASTEPPIVVSTLETPLGPMVAGAVDQGICLLEYTDRRRFEEQLSGLSRALSRKLVPGEHAHLAQLDQELREYFKGTRRTFDLPLVTPGTDFQKRVWNALMQIPYGEVESYKAQSERVSNARAVRAVARANGQNRISILIPCHRVIGSDGKLVGYASGLWRKKWLLEHEGAIRP